MIRLVVTRLLAGLVVIASVATICFFLMKLAPGGPFDSEAKQSPIVRKAQEARFHLNDPVTTQYAHYMRRLATGDLGFSIKQERTVNQIIGEHFRYSALIGLGALLVALGGGLTLGILAAARRNTWVDYLAMVIALIGVSLSSFVLGPMLIAVFAMQLGWLPPARLEGVTSLVLPSLALGIVYMGTIARLTRGGMLEVLDQDFIRTARAKGLSEKAVVLKHALRLGVLPVVTYLGPAVASLVSGSIVVEKIFQIPGLGMYFVNSIADRDHEVTIGVFVFYVTLLVILNIVVDIAFGMLDPRSRDKGRS
jgi:oligopeptide transport system permease protein